MRLDRLLSVILLTMVDANRERRASWETLPVVPHISGVRIENHEHVPAFLGYTSAGETIVEPETLCTVVVFGYWLQHIEYITFTDSNCVTSEFKITEGSFIVQTETRIELDMTFPDVDESWRMCVKQRGEHMELLLVEDIRTWISTSATVPTHIMPVYIQISIIIFLFSLSALFSGLNLGLMSMSMQELQLIINSGSPSERRYAKLILPIRRKGNYLLCTILLMNVVVNSAIAILFEDLAHGAVAFVVSSFGIVIFGEIVPQSICVKKGLAVGAKSSWLIRFFMFLTSPLSYPISRVLDVMLGPEVDRTDRNRLVELLKMQTKLENKEYAAELKIAVGAMEIANKRVRDVMTRIDDAFMLSEGEVINRSTVAHIVRKGYTRIPVHEEGNRNNVKSLLFVKDLALVDKKHNVTVKSIADYCRHPLRIVLDTMPLSDLLEEFKKGEYHLAMVEQAADPESPDAGCGWLSARLEEFKEHDCTVAVSVDRTILAIKEDEEDEINEETPLTSSSLNESYSPEGSRCPGGTGILVGLISLEDIIEEILQAEIIDESDTIIDNAHRLKRRHSQASFPSSPCRDLLNKETRASPLSLPQLHVTERWLMENITIFEENIIDPALMRRLIQMNIRHIQIFKKSPCGDQENSVVIYEAGVPSKRAILVLEGHLNADFPLTGMRFTVGPWQAFGETLLNNAFSEMALNNRTPPNTYTPDFNLVAKESCRFLQLPFGQILHAFKVTQFVKNIPKYEGQRSEDMKKSPRQNFTRKMHSVEMPVSRKLSEQAQPVMPVISKKSVAF